MAFFLLWNIDFYLDCKNKKLYNLCIKKLKEISNEGIH